MRAFLWRLDSGAVLIIAESAAEAERMWRAAASENDRSTHLPADGIPMPIRSWQVDAYSKSEMFVFGKLGAA